MGTRLRRPLLAVLVAGAATLWGPASAAAPTPAAPGAACSGGSGVTVVVDFAALGGGAKVRCAAGDPGSGLEALSIAGFSYGFAPRQPGMVCTIDSRPDPCNGAPADAYWSYWYAQRGGSWTYSNQGAGTRDPAPGSVEGWAFGAGAPPSTPPPAPTPTTTTTKAATPTTTAAARPAPAPTTAPPPTAGAGAPGPAASEEATDPTTTTTATAEDESRASTTTSRPSTVRDSSDETDTDSDTDRTSRSGDDDEQALGATPAAGDGGSGAGALVGLVLAAILAATAVWEVRRRRSPT